MDNMNILNKRYSENVTGNNKSHYKIAESQIKHQEKLNQINNKYVISSNQKSSQKRGSSLKNNDKNQQNYISQYTEINPYASHMIVNTQKNDVQQINNTKNVEQQKTNNINNNFDISLIQFSKNNTLYSNNNNFTYNQKNSYTPLKPPTQSRYENPMQNNDIENKNQNTFFTNYNEISDKINNNVQISNKNEKQSQIQKKIDDEKILDSKYLETIKLRNSQHKNYARPNSVDKLSQEDYQSPKKDKKNSYEQILLQKQNSNRKNQENLQNIRQTQSITQYQEQTQNFYKDEQNSQKTPLYQKKTEAKIEKQSPKTQKPYTFKNYNINNLKSTNNKNLQVPQNLKNQHNQSQNQMFDETLNNEHKVNFSHQTSPKHSLSFLQKQSDEQPETKQYSQYNQLYPKKQESYSKSYNFGFYKDLNQDKNNNINENKDKSLNQNAQKYKNYNNINNISVLDDDKQKKNFYDQTNPYYKLHTNLSNKKKKMILNSGEKNHQNLQNIKNYPAISIDFSKIQNLSNNNQEESQKQSHQQNDETNKNLNKNFQNSYFHSNDQKSQILSTNQDQDFLKQNLFNKNNEINKNKDYIYQNYNNNNQINNNTINNNLNTYQESQKFQKFAIPIQKIQLSSQTSNYDRNSHRSLNNYSLQNLKQQQNSQNENQSNSSFSQNVSQNSISNSKSDNSENYYILSKNQKEQTIKNQYNNKNSSNFNQNYSQNLQNTSISENQKIIEQNNSNFLKNKHYSTTFINPTTSLNMAQNKNDFNKFSTTFDTQLNKNSDSNSISNNNNDNKIKNTHIEDQKMQVAQITQKYLQKKNSDIQIPNLNPKYQKKISRENSQVSSNFTNQITPKHTTNQNNINLNLENINQNKNQQQKAPQTQSQQCLQNQIQNVNQKEKINNQRQNSQEKITDKSNPNDQDSKKLESNNKIDQNTQIQSNSLIDKYLNNNNDTVYQNQNNLESKQDNSNDINKNQTIQEKQITNQTGVSEKNEKEKKPLTVSQIIKEAKAQKPHLFENNNLNDNLQNKQQQQKQQQQQMGNQNSGQEISSIIQELQNKSTQNPFKKNKTQAQILNNNIINDSQNKVEIQQKYSQNLNDEPSKQLQQQTINTQEELEIQEQNFIDPNNLTIKSEQKQQNVKQGFIDLQEIIDPSQLQNQPNDKKIKQIQEPQQFQQQKQLQISKQQTKQDQHYQLSKQNQQNQQSQKFSQKKQKSLNNLDSNKNLNKQSLSKQDSKTNVYSPLKKINSTNHIPKIKLDNYANNSFNNSLKTPQSKTKNPGKITERSSPTCRIDLTLSEYITERNFTQSLQNSQKQNEQKIEKEKEKEKEKAQKTPFSNKQSEKSSQTPKILQKQDTLQQEQKKNEQNLIQEQKNQLQEQNISNITNNQEKIVDMNIDDFTILQQIGRGQFATVYLAIHNLTNLLVAIKVIKKTLIFNYDIEDMLLQEIKLQMFLDHPNIAKLMGVFSDFDNVYLVQEYADGGNLFEQLKQFNNRRFAESYCSKIIKQILLALQVLHKNYIIHRDIKPENLLIYGDIVKLCDFGCAVHSPKQQETTRCGTLDYLSPEMAKNQVYGKAIDIWAVGILTYEFLFGKSPFYHIKDEDEVYKAIRHEEFKFDNSVFSEEAKNFIQQMCQKKPEKRLTVDQALQHNFITKYDEQNEKLSEFYQNQRKNIQQTMDQVLQ